MIVVCGPHACARGRKIIVPSALLRSANVRTKLNQASAAGRVCVAWNDRRRRRRRRRCDMIRPKMTDDDHCPFAIVNCNLFCSLLAADRSRLRVRVSRQLKLLFKGEFESRCVNSRGERVRVEEEQVSLERERLLRVVEIVVVERKWNFTQCFCSEFQAKSRRRRRRQVTKLQRRAAAASDSEASRVPCSRTTETSAASARITTLKCLKKVHIVNAACLNSNIENIECSETNSTVNGF